MQTTCQPGYFVLPPKRELAKKDPRNEVDIMFASNLFCSFSPWRQIFSIFSIPPPSSRKIMVRPFVLLISFMARRIVSRHNRVSLGKRERKREGRQKSEMAFLLASGYAIASVFAHVWVSEAFWSWSSFSFSTMPLTCRFYKHKYPEIDDVVMVNVRSIAEMGAYVNLLEYNNIEGMILLSELSRRRIRSINKLIRVGRNECVVVIRVDKDKG